MTTGAARDESAPRRLLFYSHDGTGLGHLRITLGVASAYAALRPQDSLLLLTGSLHTSAFDLPANLDYIKLPAMPKREIYASLPPTEGFTGSHNSTIRFRTALALTTMQSFDPHVVVVDHAPAGLFRELAPSLEWLRSSARPASLALLMRDVTFGPEQTRTIWRNEGIYPLLDDGYDRILVYGDQDVFDPVSAYEISERAAARMRFCGYLAPRSPLRSPAEVRRELGVGGAPLVAVSVGGGVDGGPLLRAYLEGLPDFLGSHLHSYVVTGPLLPENEREALASLARSQPALQIVDFASDFAAVVQAADVVVCMGGYNSLTEAVYFGKRPVVVPRPPGPEEQLIRAEGFAQLGLATVVRPESLTSATLWQAIEQELARTTSLASSLPFDGANVIAHELAELAHG